MSQRFTPYGALQARDSAGAIPTLRYQWTGREYDAETGNYFHRSRYYDPGAKRFVQEDRIGFNGGPNLFQYVAGQPLRGRDPFGNDLCWFGIVYVGYTWERGPNGEHWLVFDYETRLICSDSQSLDSYAIPSGGGDRGNTTAPRPASADTTCPQFFLGSGAAEAYKRAFDWSHQEAARLGYLGETGGTIYTFGGTTHYQNYPPQLKDQFDFSRDMQRFEGILGVYHLHMNVPGPGGAWGPSAKDDSLPMRPRSRFPLATIAYAVDSMWVSDTNGITTFCGKVPK
jgi:RHS repeat-associated protein